MTQTAVSSRSVARRPNKPKKGEPFRLNLVLPGELVAEVDNLAEQLKSSDVYKRDVSRTDAIKVLLRDALDARAKRSK